MSRVKSTKINRLLQRWPKGTVATAIWLKTMGVRFDLVDRYRKSGWVQSIGRGAVLRAGDAIHWQGAVFAIQEQLRLSIHPGGKTALGIQGFAHNLPLGKEKVFLFGARGEHLPVWFSERDWKADLRVVRTNLLGADSQTGLVKKDFGEFSLRISSPERAILEMLYCIPKDSSPNEAATIMEGLVTLNPKVIQALLVECSSVKVKRLFLVLAERYKHAWLAKLRLGQVDLGKGKRMLVKNGFLHPKYQITVPSEWKAASDA